MNLIEEKTFKNKDFNTERLALAEYDSCTFEDCNFANANLSRIKFVACAFENCDFSMANISDASFKEVQFNDCKMLGLRFEYCNTFLFEIHCNKSNLDMCSFYEIDSRRCTFIDSSLQEVDFSDANLSKVKFQECNLTKAIFDNTDITFVDFTTAINYSIDLSKNKIKKTKFSRSGLSGLLDRFDIEIV